MNLKSSTLSFITFVLSLLWATNIYAQEQEPKTPEEMAYEQAQRFEKELGLKPHQTFYIDSVLQHDMRAMQEDIRKMQMSGTQEMTVYQQIREQWTKQIETSFRKILDDEQWIKYLKSVGKYKKDKKRKRK